VSFICDACSYAMSIILSSLINHKLSEFWSKLWVPKHKTTNEKECTCKSDSKFLHQQNYYKHNIAVLNNIGKTQHWRILCFIVLPFVAGSLVCHRLAIFTQKKTLFPTN
jgi:hypothetical protein